MARPHTRAVTRSVTNRRRVTWRGLASRLASNTARQAAFSLGRATGNALRSWQNHRNLTNARSQIRQAPPSGGTGGHRGRFSDMNVTDLTNDKFTMVVNKRRLKRASKTKLKLQETFQQLLVGSEGAHAMDELRVHFHAASFTAPTTSRNSKTSQSVTYFDMNPNSTTTGVSVGPFSGAVAQSMAQSINIETGRCELTFGNLENSSTTVWVYFFLCKKNTNNSPANSWNDDLDERDYALPVDVPTVTSDTTWATGGVTPAFIGTFPTTPNIKRNWKLLKVRKFNLDGGQSHTINYFLKMNKRVDKDYVSTLNSNAANYIAGLSIVPLVIARGSMVGINDTGASTTANEVTFAPVKLGIIGLRKYTFSALPEPPTYPLDVGCYGIVAGTTHVYGPKLINDEDASANVVVV